MIIKLRDIDEAIAGLGYKNRDTLKFRLIQAIREHYGDADAGGAVEGIDAGELIGILWGLEGDGELKARRKNLSSVKSSVNADLRKLYNEGRNPQGVIIGQDNIFDMSDEAKNKTLGTIDAILREDGADVVRKIAEMLNEVDDLLSRSGSGENCGGPGKFDRIKDIVLNLSRKMGLSLNDGNGTGDADATANDGVADNVEVTDDVVEETVDEFADTPEEAEDVAIYEASDETAVSADTAVEITSDEGANMAVTEDRREECAADAPHGYQGDAQEAAAAGEAVPGEIVEELAEEAAIEESGTEVVVEELDESREVAEEDLHDKAELLSTLAEAAKVLENLGPDLSGSPYSEEEIREKARLLSEEFERDISVRERFFNQHIFIRGGDYTTGEKNPERKELPASIVRIREFYIGKFPVTNALFETFVEKTGYRTTAERNGYGFVYTPCAQRTRDAVTGREMFIRRSHLTGTRMRGACWHRPNGPGSSLHNKRRHPVVQVSLEDACAFAAWTGKRIPTESEWEAAARTIHGNTFPWGNEWAHGSCNVEKSYFGDTTPVDMYVKFANYNGVADTLGNVQEWTLDPWEKENAGERNGTFHVVKGGSWVSESPIRLANRHPMNRGMSSNILGFRCVAI